MKLNFSRLLVVVGAALLSAATSPTLAQTYPARPIKFLVPQAAASTADIVSRVLGAQLAKELGQPVVVENKAGAGGTIAMTELARSAPDGYTIMLASQGTLIFNLALYANPGYDSLKDFAPILLVGGVSNVMIVPPTSSANSVMEIIAQAKAKPGILTFSSGGSGTSHHMSGVLLNQLAAVDTQHIPYKGAPQGILAVMSGEVSMGLYNTPTVINQIKENKVKALAVTSLQRSSLLPSVPTLDESGVKAYEVNTWFGMISPAGTPADIVTKLHDQLGKILAVPALIEQFAAQGFDVAPVQPSSALAKLIEDDLAKWPAIIKKSGARVD
ncbi:MAG: tripartite tricarboxylate transporter substrate binding protein [Alcaligenaceae bacterium]